jgi:hypothetical protein
MCTAIGQESAHTNEIGNTASTGNGALDTLLTFSTSNTSNWGVWNTVNFDTENLFFEDSNGSWVLGSLVLILLGLTIVSVLIF